MIISARPAISTADYSLHPKNSTPGEIGSCQVFPIRPTQRLRSPRSVHGQTAAGNLQNSYRRHLLGLLLYWVAINKAMCPRGPTFRSSHGVNVRGRQPLCWVVDSSGRLRPGIIPVEEGLQWPRSPLLKDVVRFTLFGCVASPTVR